jgi:PAS domain S-box-containing protein
MRFKIRTKLIIAFSLIIFSFIVIGGILVLHSANTFHNSVHKIKSIAEERAVITNLIFIMEEALMPGNDYIITGDKKYIDDFYKVSDEVEKRMKEVKGILHDPVEEGKILGDTNIAWQGIKEISLKIFAISNPSGNRDAAILMEEMDYKLAYPAIKRLTGLRDMHIEEFQKAVKTADKVWMHSWIIMIAGTFLLTVIGTIFALFYSRIFVLPIKQVHNGADAIAKGDFKVRLDIKTGDEIEQLSQAMNEMAKQLDSMYANLDGMVIERTIQIKSILDAANDAVICMDIKGGIYIWNKEAEEMFGYSVDEAVGKELHKLIVPEKYRGKADEGLKNFFKTGQGPVVGKVVEVLGQRKDGTEFPVELSVSAVRIGDEWQAIGIIRDVTERKKAEGELMQRLEELEQFRKVTIQRELRMEELKRRNKELEEELKILRGMR